MRGQQGLMPPDAITSRVDGWVGSADCIPPRAAEMILAAMPSLSGDSISDIRARMQARQSEHERRRKRQRIVERMARLRHA
jgi:hypothetical protein